MSRDIEQFSSTRWAWVEIDTEALRWNMKQFLRLCNPRQMVMAVVKADAYGHGAEQVARVCLEAGASRLAVATVDEGIELRAAGLDAPIQILAEPPASTVDLIVENDLISAVDTIDFAVALGDAADVRGKRAKYHLAVDSGMNRIGVLAEDAASFLKRIDFHRGLELEGVFTHFATADEPDEWDYRRQLERFEAALDDIREAGFDPGIVHCANSAAAIRYPEARFDMIRMGIALYGLHPSPATWGIIDLKPVMSVHARVSFEKTPAVGEGVSYGLHYRTPGGKQIVTIPIGYADGMRRALSGRTDVLIGGRRWCQVGNICMDQMMAEVVPGMSIAHQVEPVQVGDEVVVMGRQGDDEITADDLAEMTGTITHEITCGFGMRMQRFYV